MNAISVIVPVYNMEKYLGECLESILEQTLKDIEVVCINDGSTDLSLKILKEYEKKDKRLRIIDKKNEGVSAARNDGIQISNGEYICFIDPDDMYPDNETLEILYRTAKQNNAKICGGSFSRYDQRTNKILTEFSDSLSPYTFQNDGFLKFENYQFDYGYHRFIYSLELLRSNKIMFPPYSRFQDPPFFVKAMLCAQEFYAIRRVTYRYRVGHQSVNWTVEKLQDFSRGICDNLKISAQYHLKDLHALTVRRIVEHKKAIISNRALLNDIRMQKAVFELIANIQPDLLQNSKWKVRMEELFDIFHKILLIIDEQEKRYDDIKQSETFRVGEIILYIPRKVYLWIHNIKLQRKY